MRFEWLTWKTEHRDMQQFIAEFEAVTGSDAAIAVANVAFLNDQIEANLIGLS